jgi:hypothetical protein
MCLGVILDKQEVVATANVTDACGVGTAAIEVYNHDGASLCRNGLFYEAVVYLECVDGRLYEHRNKGVLGDGEDGGNVGVCGDDDLVAVLQPSQFLVSAEDECQGIETVGAAYAILRADIFGIVLLKSTRSLTTKVPTTAQYLVGSMLVGFIDGF